ncbi:MAG TPA: tyrosine-type recombinase/integrase, partial [Pirellulaceae bacterium]|nr:tyrosine-type recombinase/integrase [Pirellulaceae bacterium]
MQATSPWRDLFEESYKPMNLRGCSPLTPGGHLAAINGLEAYWRSLEAGRPGKTLRIGDVSETLIAKYLDHLLVVKRRRRATHNKHLRHLTAQWNWALSEGLVPRKLRLTQIKEEERDPDCWSQEEFTRLLFVAAELRGYIGDVPACYWWPALILMVYSTGVRIDAIMRIRSADLDLEQRVVRVQAETQKDKAEQRFTLLPDVCGVLGRIRPERLPCVFDDWPLDRTAKARARNGWDALRRAFRKLLAKAELPTTSRDLWHKLRRTFATEVTLSSGLKVAQAL